MKNSEMYPIAHRHSFNTKSLEGSHRQSQSPFHNVLSWPCSLSSITPLAPLWVLNGLHQIPPETGKCLDPTSFWIYESESRSLVFNSFNPMDYSPGQNSRMSSLSLLQGIFPTQGSHPHLPHCMQILYQLSHKGSPGILEWVTYPFSRGSSWSRNQTRGSCIAGGFFTSWTMREAQHSLESTKD